VLAPDLWCGEVLVLHFCPLWLVPCMAVLLVTIVTSVTRVTQFATRRTAASSPTRDLEAVGQDGRP
jgi:hypothetical protein